MTERSEDRPAAEARPAAPRGRPPAAAAGQANATHRVEAVERALSILDAFVGSEPGLTLAELARRTRLNPSTILRLSASLARFGYLRRGADGRFRLGPTPLQLGVLYRESFALADHVRPVLARLADAAGETATFYVREGGQRVCLFRHQAQTAIRHHVEEGAKLPLDVGASAHVLLAFDGTACQGRWAAVREAGHAVSLGERDPESAAIAAPVFGADRKLVGALAIAGLLSRLQRADQGQLIRLVREAAGALTRDLGGAPPGAR